MTARAENEVDPVLAKVAMLVHELRNPLWAIGNAVKIVRDSPEDAAARTWATDVIERQAHQLGHLVEDLLDVSLISRGKVRLRKQLVGCGKPTCAVSLTGQPGSRSIECGGRLSHTAFADPQGGVECTR